LDIKLNQQYLEKYVADDDIVQYQDKIKKAISDLENKKGLGNDFLGWINLPSSIQEDEIEKIKKTAELLRKNSELVIVIGIGGSYLGSRAVIEAVQGVFRNEEETLEIIFAGNQMASDYLNSVVNKMQNKETSLIVISKSGTTTEPAIAFRVLKKELEKKYKGNVKERIVAITDAHKGALRTLCENEGYTSFIVPDDVGGRYSVLSPVGLLPIQTAGIDIVELIRGASLVEEESKGDNSLDNIVNRYAVIRNVLYGKGKNMELLANFNPAFHYISEWWKQLYGESEGKDLKGLFPTAADFSTDLHSLGQWIQEGQRILFETFLLVEKSKTEIEIESDNSNLDKLNYLSGKNLDYINQKAYEGTALAHYDGQVPNLSLSIPALTPFYIGQLIFFFEKACGISGYLLEVNPFNQPGVEAYKKNMFRLLGKPE